MIDLLDRASCRSRAGSYMDMMDGVSASDNNLGYVLMEDQGRSLVLWGGTRMDHD